MSYVYSWTTIEVLHDLVGQPWDPLTQAYMRALRPSIVREIRGGVMKTDAVTWRVSVHLSDDDRIERIEQEVEVTIPTGIENGFDLRTHIEKRARR